MLFIHVTKSGDLIQRVFCTEPAVVIVQDFDLDGKPTKWPAESLDIPELVALLDQAGLNYELTCPSGEPHLQKGSVCAG